MLHDMLLIRRFEEKLGQCFAAGKLAGSMFHLSIGQEGAAVGAVGALGPVDYLTSNHRGHGHMIARGGDLHYMMAEMFGKATGYCKGKGGSMHIADLDLGHLGANGIVGGSLALAAGAAMACQRRRSGGVVLCIIGDGACNEGLFHEAANMAGLWNLPIIFLVENNRYAMSTPITAAFANPRLIDRAPGYRMVGQEVDGMDVLAVRAAAMTAIDRARRGDGPTLIDCHVYRYHGHSRMDPANYRSPEEEEAWRRRDPILLLRERMQAAELLSEADLAAMEAEIERRLEAAVAFADQSPYPRPEDLFTDVYAEIEGGA